MPTFTAAAGDETFTGDDAVTDTVDFSQTATRGGVRVQLYVDNAQQTYGSGTDRFVSIENVIGSNVSDDIAASYSDNEFWGMGGNDNLTLFGGHDIAHGGAGDDYIYAMTGNGDSAVMTGDDGNDRFRIGATDGHGAIVADGGTGDDVFDLSGPGAMTLTLGEGRDMIRLNSFQQPVPVPAVTVTDFRVGDAGDSLDINDYLHSLFPAWNGEQNAFAAGLLRLTASTGDTLVEVKVSGTWQTLFRLQNVDSRDLTAFNLGYITPPGGNADGVMVIGSGAAAGNAGDDIVVSGNTLYGGDGNDYLDLRTALRAEGGAGNDVIVAGFGSAVMKGGTGADQFVFGDSHFAASILDFNPSEDVLDFYAVHAERAMIEDSAGQTIISFYTGDTRTGQVYLNGPSSQLNGSNVVYHLGGTVATRPVIASALPAAATLTLTAPFTLAAGQARHFDAFGYSLRGVGANFTNAGTITVTSSALTGGSSGVLIDYSGSTYDQSGPAGLPVITNDTTGIIRVSNLSPSNAYGQTGIDGYDVVNRGTIEVTGVQATVYGVQATHLFTNSGTVKVWSAEYAIGALATQVVNTGTIAAYGDNARGIQPGYSFAPSRPFDGTSYSVANYGTVIAEDGLAAKSTYGIYETGPIWGEMYHVYLNAGTITADYSFYSDDYWFSPPLEMTDIFYNTVTGVMNGDMVFGNGTDTLHNDGTVNGAVDTGDGDDRIDGAGTIAGAVYLGLGNDVYAGATAQQSGGGIYGGLGNDVIEAGAGAQYLFGEDGIDTLRGGGGDDWIDGGRGGDTLDGGSGYDTLSFRSSASAVAANLATNAVTSAGNSDIIANFEAVVGSRYNDTLTGTTAANWIDGGSGDDVLAGGLGADTFTLVRGDGHDTISDFRANGDADLIDVWGFSAWRSVQQTGADTLVVFDTDTSVLLKNTLATAVTTAMFTFHAGTDAHASVPGDPSLDGDALLFVNVQTTVATGEHLVYDHTGAYAVYLNGGFAFDNYGTVSVDDTYWGHGIDTSVEGPIDMDTALRVVNHAGAVFEVVAHGASGIYGEHAEATGLLAANGSPDFLNEGTFKVSSSWMARGGWVFTNFARTFDNAGTFLVSAADSAIGFAFHGSGALTVRNEGLFRVSGGTSAVAFSYIDGRSDDSIFTNSGTIIAETPTQGQLHEAVAISSAGGHFINSGTIQATDAFYGKTLDSFQGSGDEFIENSGNIFGGLQLFGGEDRVINSGRIDGVIEMGAHNDLYDGHAGTQTGGVWGGDGDDTMIGGTANDTFDGGDGIDTLSYAYTTQGVTVDITDGAHTVAGNGIDTVTSFENLTGSAFADHLGGTSAANILDGGKGDDVLTGGAGADVFLFRAGDGHDTISDFSVASDVIDASSVIGFESYLSLTQIGSDTRVSFAGGDWILLQNVTASTLTAANFKFLTETSPRTFTGTAGNDTITGGKGTNTIDGLDGNDTLTGNISDDKLNGGNGDDLLIGTTGQDIYSGGAGYDTLSFASFTGWVVINLHDGYLTSVLLGGISRNGQLSSIERVIATAGNDTIRGTAGDDRIEGLAGNDIFNGDTGADMMIGGTGDDTYYVDTAGDLVIEASGEGSDIVSATLSYILPVNVETLYLHGDNLNGTGNALNNSLYGTSGNNVLDGGAGADALYGWDGNDTASYASASGGVTAFLGGPQLNTGDATGDSYISIENLTGSAYADILGGLAGGTVDGGDGNDWIYGTTGAETLLGGNGNDVLEGRAGADILNGGDGADVASYRNSTAGIVLDMVNAANSTGDAAGDSLTNVENIWGSAYNDTIRSTITSGGQVYGFEGNDTLAGYTGNDVFYGGAGIDTMTGGAGGDDFFYLSWIDHVNAYGTPEPYEGGDTITDFSHGTDRIIVSRYWFGFGNIGGPAAALTSTHADFITSGGATSTRPTFFWNDVTKVLQFDPDGTGASTAVTIATLTGATLTLSDIWTA